MIPIMEHFSSIQGEGKRTGNVSIFVRLGGCNFSCAGFGVEYQTPEGETKYGCDSWYSVDKSFKNTWELLDYKELITQINKHIVPEHYKKADIVITGGEPTMYWKDKDFQKVLRYYSSRGHHITIETNASIDLEIVDDYQREIAFSMSVKLAVSGEKEHKRINIDNISNIAAKTKESYLKFVVKDQKDIDEILDVIQSIPDLVDIYLMPLGETRVALEKTRMFVIEAAHKHGFMYSDRLHIIAWDDEPGV